MSGDSSTPDRADGLGDGDGFGSLGPFAEAVGLVLTRAEPDLVEATYATGPHLHQPFGLVNGGAHCAVVETLASVGGAVWLGDDGYVVGVSNATDFFRPVREGELLARATPVHRGLSQQVWTVEIRTGADKLVARGQVRLQNLSGDPR